MLAATLNHGVALQSIGLRRLIISCVVKETSIQEGLRTMRSLWQWHHHHKFIIWVLIIIVLTSIGLTFDKSLTTFLAELYSTFLDTVRSLALTW